MMHLTPQQLQKIKARYPAQDDHVILLAAMYLLKHLGKNEFDVSIFNVLDKAFAAPVDNHANHNNIVTELSVVIKKYQTELQPVLSQTPFLFLTSSQAQTLGARLLANTTFALITSDDALDLSENLALQGLTCLFNAINTDENKTDPEQIQEILNNLFNKFPETSDIPAFSDLLAEAELILENKKTDYRVVKLAKETFSIQTTLAAASLARALEAFKQWKRQRRTFSGLLYQIIQLADALANKYPAAKYHIIEFCYLTFCNSMSDRNLLAKYYAKFADIIDTFIALNDKQLVYSLCFQLINNAKIFDPWVLIEIFDHPVFKKFSLSQRKIILNLVSTLLTNNAAFDKKLLRVILDKCESQAIRPALLQRLNEFYRATPFPPLTTFIEWLNLIPKNDATTIADFLGDSYVMFNQPVKVDPTNADTVLERQLNKFKHDLDAYADSSRAHTRKTRAAYLTEFSKNHLMDIDNKSVTEKKSLRRKIIAELYLQYSTIENASSILSRALEKRLLKIMQIPKDAILQAAKDKRESFSYKLCTFFKAFD